MSFCHLQLDEETATRKLLLLRNGALFLAGEEDVENAKVQRLRKETDVVKILARLEQRRDVVVLRLLFLYRFCLVSHAIALFPPVSVATVTVNDAKILLDSIKVINSRVCILM